MPELAEVEITRRKLLPLLRGRKILDFWTDWPKGLSRVEGLRGLKANGVKRIADSMRGRTILDVSRIGKVLVLKFSGKPERALALHLGMSGRLSMFEVGLRTLRAAKAVRDDRWVHFRWRLSGGRELHFIDPRKFERVWYGAPESLRRDPYLSRLGADAAAISSVEFVQRFHRILGRIKPALLRQDVVSGIGNIIADESLWQARIHPLTPIPRLAVSDLVRLHRALRATLRSILSSGGTSIRNFRHPDGKAGRFQERRSVYGLAGAPCPRCRTKLQRLVVAGRGTTVCPRCQRLQTSEA